MRPVLSMTVRATLAALRYFRSSVSTSRSTGERAVAFLTVWRVGAGHGGGQSQEVRRDRWAFVLILCSKVACGGS